MGRHKNRRKNKSCSSTPIKTKTKQRDYISDGASATTNMYALKTERYKLIGMFVLEVVGIIGGIWLILCNVRDEGFCLEFSNFKLQCSLVGLGIAVISFIALIRTNPNISIKNEKGNSDNVVRT